MQPNLLHSQQYPTHHLEKNNYFPRKAFLFQLKHRKKP